MGAIDPFRELRGRGLRAVVLDCIEVGRVSIPVGHAAQRMEERHVTVPEVEATLRSGQLVTDSCVAGKWRYCARKQQVRVIFTFDVDDDGNLLVVVTVMRKEP